MTVPVYKINRDPDNIERYRPNSFITKMNKIYKENHSPPSTFVHSNFLFISNAQFGFTKRKGAAHACYELQSSMQSVYTKKSIGICIFVNFSEAFLYN